MRASNKRIDELNKQKFLWMIIALMLLLVCVKQYTALDDSQDAFKRMEVTVEQAQHQIENHQNEIDRLQQLVVSYENELETINSQLSISQESERDLSTQSKKSNRGFTHAEIYALEKMVEAEATGGTEWHMLVVANVLLNRYESQYFPNEIFPMLYQYGIKDNGKIVFQFSPIGDNRYFYCTPSQSAKNAVSRALAGEDNSQGALYFMNPDLSNPDNVTWFDKNLEYLFYLEGHKFYK